MPLKNRPTTLKIARITIHGFSTKSHGWKRAECRIRITTQWSPCLFRCWNMSRGLTSFDDLFSRGTFILPWKNLISNGMWLVHLNINPFLFNFILTFRPEEFVEDVFGAFCSSCTVEILVIGYLLYIVLILFILLKLFKPLLFFLLIPDDFQELENTLEISLIYLLGDVWEFVPVICALLVVTSKLWLNLTASNVICHFIMSFL